MTDQALKTIAVHVELLPEVAEDGDDGHRFSIRDRFTGATLADGWVGGDKAEAQRKIRKETNKRGWRW